jgi:hypothetical protein
MTAARTEPKWSDCPTGKAMIGLTGLILILLGTLTVQMRELRQTVQTNRVELYEVKTDVKWLCRAVGSDMAAIPPRKPIPVN